MFYKCDCCKTTLTSKYLPQDWVAFHGQFSKNKQIIAILHKYICPECQQSDFKGGRRHETD